VAQSEQLRDLLSQRADGCAQRSELIKDLVVLAQ
jgi:hypothetical protein